MTRLIVEEAGQKRAFRLGEGVLTVGSGAEAKLRLKSPDVAEIHVELEVHGDSVSLRPRPGVLPPSMDGQPLTGSGALKPGRVVELGSARIWIDDGGRAAAAGKPQASAAAKPAPVAKAASPKPAPRTRADRAVVRRSEPRIKRGIPTWLTIVLILGVVGIAIAFYAKVTADMGKETAATPQSRIDRARIELAAGNLDEAENRLDLIPTEASLSAIQRSEITALREEIAERRAQAEVDVANLLGSKYFDVMLKRYEGNHLTGDPEPAKVRLFLKRCREFRERWPRHPELDWVSRQEARFLGFVDLSAPPTWEDVDWEIFYLTGGAPRNYKAAFEMLNEFERRASSEERVKVRELRERLVSERAEYHTDKIYQAEYEFNEKDNPNKSVWWLVHAVIWIGDEEMANQAAEFLVKIPNLEAHLRGYERDYPERYAAVLEHPLVRDWAEEHGMLDG